jgi:hypothetical protein
MMRRKLLKWLGLSLPLVFLLGWLFLGVFKDREFGKNHLFVKHHPTLKFSFYAPLGKSDRTLNELNPEQSHEEAMYREYVEDKGGSRRSIALW